jgi:hypothetical protein
MAENYASNYGGTKGKATIIPQGQTSSVYGNDPKVQAKVPGATPLKP